MPPPAAPPLVLTIAGFDPTSGAGVSADIKAISANQAYALACIAALTVQDTHGTQGYVPVDAGFLQDQLAVLLADLHPRAVKIGMLGSAAAVNVVADQLERHEIPWIVLDPIYAASNGTRLMDDAGWKRLRERLVPMATVLTPNLPEAEILTGVNVTKAAELEQAAIAVHALGPKWVVIKGGHLERPVDLLYDGTTFVPLVADRVRTNNTHGTGCTFSAALAANLANGKLVPDAVVMAKAYLAAALKQSFPLGDGPGPLNHLYRLQEATPSRNVDPAPPPEFTVR